MMLQRAASNAYSWWWASHIRTKQSKWLEENLQDLEEKVNYILKIINEDGDTFAQRAEMYYRKRPEIVGFVEEAFRSYRALAERFDHLSRELQSANRTIATVFPEHVQFPSDEEDEENPDKKPKFIAKGANIPKVPEVPKKDFRSRSSLLSRKGKTNLRRTSSSDSKREIARSGLSKGEALEEIDKLQKEILAQQTEKEFVRSAYESRFEKYWDIENEITEMQKRVCSLQDEFGIGAVIEDGEARMLMANAALSSCRDTVAKLEEQQKESAQEAETEKERIISSKEKFDALRRKFDQMDVDLSQREEIEKPGVIQESVVESSSRDFVKEEMAVGSEDVLTVMQLVEKIDALVERVVSLETDSVSQTVLVETLRRKNDELQEHILELDKDNATLLSGSEEMRKRIGLLEDEISRLKNLYQKFSDQNKKLQTYSTEAKIRIDDLSGKLQSVKMDDEIESSGIFQEARAVSGESKEEEKMSGESKEEKKNGDAEEIKVEEEEEKKKDGEVLVLDVVSDERQQEKKDSAVSETASSVFDSETEEMETEEEEEGEETPDLRQSFPNGLEDREKILLEEYGSVLRNYREVKKKLRDVEKKNRDGFFELALQVRELKNNLADRDIEIQKLREKLESPMKVPFNQTQENQSENDGQRESISQLSISPVSNFLSSSTSSHLQREDLRKTTPKSRGNDVRVTFAEPEHNNSPHCDGDNNNGNITEVEERIRSDIDELLEQNLEFWLRFSTSVHQIQKFQTSVHDLKSEISKLNNKKAKKQQDFGNQSRLASEARPIYRHLREVKTEMQLWLENNTVLKEELQGRHSSLCNIQDDISRVTGFRENASASISDYQAAKFHGEVLNMKQENTRVSDELDTGLERVRGMKVDVERMLKNAEDDFGIANAQNVKSQTGSSEKGRPRIPLRSFLFGVKLKKHKQQSQKRPSLFSCAGPSLHKQSSDTCNPPARLPE